VYVRDCEVRPVPRTGVAARQGWLAVMCLRHHRPCGRRKGLGRRVVPRAPVTGKDRSAAWFVLDGSDRGGTHNSSVVCG